MNKEISAVDFQGMPEFEEVDFRNLKSGVMQSYLCSILLGYISPETREAMITDPAWNPQKIKVQITVNGMQILHEHFEAMCSEFSNRLMKQRYRAGRWDSFEAAVLQKAEQLASGAFTKFNDTVWSLQQQLEHLTESAEEMVKREWAAISYYTVTEEMLQAGMTYSVDPANQELPRSAHVTGLYRAMVTKRPETVNSYLDATVVEHCNPQALETVKSILANCLIIDADPDKIAAEIYAAIVNTRSVP